MLALNPELANQVMMNDLDQVVSNKSNYTIRLARELDGIANSGSQESGLSPEDENPKPQQGSPVEDEFLSDDSLKECSMEEEKAETMKLTLGKGSLVNREKV